MTLRKSDNPLVSIIINNYNYEEFLEDAIESALNQSYKNVEIIFVDDGSTDTSVSIARKYQHQIACVWKENGGQASAINCGFSICRGDFILILDSDDMLYEDAIFLCVEAIAGIGKNISKVQAPLRISDSNKKIDGNLLPYQRLHRGSLRSFSLKNGPASYPSPPMSGNMWSRHFLSQVLPIPEKLYKTSADAYLFTLAPLFGDFERVETPIGIYRIHNNNSYWNKKVSCQKLRREIYIHKQRCLIMEKFFRAQGEKTESKTWRMNHRYYLAKIVSLWKMKGADRPPISCSAFSQAVVKADIRFQKKAMWLIWFLLIAIVPKRLSYPLIQAYVGLQFRV